MKITSSVLIVTVLALASTSDARPRPRPSSSSVLPADSPYPTGCPHPTTGGPNPTDGPYPSGGLTTCWPDWNNTASIPTPTGSDSWTATPCPTWSASSSFDNTVLPTDSPYPTGCPHPTTGGPNPTDGPYPSGGLTTCWPDWNNTASTPTPTGSDSWTATPCPTWSASSSFDNTVLPTDSPYPTGCPHPTTGGPNPTDGPYPSGGLTTCWPDWNNTASTPTPTGSDSWTATPCPTWSNTVSSSRITRTPCSTWSTDTITAPIPTWN